MFAFVPGSSNALLFGGYGCTGPLCLVKGYLGDTWEFKNGAWTKLAPNPTPIPRAGAAFAPLGGGGYYLLYGGMGCKTSGCILAHLVLDYWRF
jgi:hypothetical protein